VPAPSHEDTLLQHALARGFLTPDAIQRARAELSGRPGVTLLQHLRERYLTPEQVGALQALHRRSSARLQAVARPPANPPAATGEPTSGERIGAYLLLEELGRGGMGMVYRARHEGLNRDVALKLIGGDFTNPRRRDRFRLEAESVARLSHPGIVAVHDVGEARGRPYLVMDLIEGGSLESRLREGPLPSDDAATIIRELADALHHAHDAQVLHRDVKPANVLLRGDGSPVLVDFGLAKHVDTQGPTKTGQAMGTPAYSPPEQLVGDPLDWTADVYGLGATFYALLTGRPPFEAESVIELVSAVCNREPTPPSRLREG
jgi:serine/threonine protein kinase